MKIMLSLRQNSDFSIGILEVEVVVNFIWSAMVVKSLIEIFITNTEAVVDECVFINIKFIDFQCCGVVTTNLRNSGCLQIIIDVNDQVFVINNDVES